MLWHVFFFVIPKEWNWYDRITDVTTIKEFPHVRHVP